MTDCGLVGCEGTSLEAVESQFQPELLYSGLPNRVEVKKKPELKAVFEVMANLTGDVDAPPTMMEDVEVDDGVQVEHVSKHIKVRIDGDGISIGSPNRIDDHAKSTTDDPLGRPEMNWQLVTESQSRRVVDDQNDKLIATIGNAVRIGEDAGDADERRFRN